MEFLQGEVYWAVAKDLDIAGHEQMKSRPYVIVSRTLLNQRAHRPVFRTKKPS